MSSARAGEPALRAAIPASDEVSARSPAAYPSPPARPKIQRSSNADPGATTAPAPGSELESGSMLTREAHAEVATGTSAVRNCAAGVAVCGRICTNEIAPSGSKRNVRFALCDPVVAVHEAGETTRTPSDIPFFPRPCTHPEAASTFAPSEKWQSQ